MKLFHKITYNGKGLAMWQIEMYQTFRYFRTINVNNIF